MRCILKNGVFLMWRDNGFVLEHHDILIENHTLCGLDENAYADRVYDLAGRTVVPSFFNIHCHLGEMFYREICRQNWSVEQYLKYTEAENNNLSSDERAQRWNISAQQTLDELMSYGIIGLAAGRSALPCRRFSLYNMCGYPLMKSNKLREFIPSLERFCLYKKMHESSACHVGILLHSLYMTDETMLNFAHKAMLAGASFFTVHISEDDGTRNKEIAAYKMPPINILDEFNLLSDKAVLAHCGYTSQEELRLLAKNNANVAVCPVSNNYLGSHMPDLYQLEKLSIKWCIATDGPATGRTMSLTKQTACAKEKFPRIEDGIYFLSITQRPAEIFNCQYYTGRIEIGTDASFNIIEKTYIDAKDALADLIQDKVTYQFCRF